MTKKEIYNVLNRRFFLISASCFLFVTAIALALLIQNLNLQDSELKAKECLKVEHLEGVTANDIKSAISDLVFLSSHPEVHIALEERDPDAFQRLSKVYLSFCKTSTMYDQIRLIDTTGIERIRVNFNNGQPYIVVDDDLQNKGKRYYFLDTYSLEPGQVYLSPMDLNIENGQIEQPLKPMIRLGTPITNYAGDKKGIVLLNYFGSAIIQDLESVSSETTGLTMLLNSDGYWLKGPNPEEEWGFMYEDRKNSTLAQHDNQAWQEIISSETGQFQNRQGIYTHVTVSPLLSRILTSDGTGEPFEPSSEMLSSKEYFWKIVSFVPASRLADNIRATVLQWLPFYGIIVLFLAFISHRLSSAITYRLQAQEQLQTAHDELDIRVKERTAELQTANKALRERVKELTCMYGVSTSIQGKETLDEVYKDILTLIPPGLRYPEITCARITLGDLQMTTETFEATRWKLSADIIIRREKVGVIDIFYLEEKPGIDEGPFLKEERDLIDSIAEYLANITERKQLQELKSRAERLELAGTIAGQVAHDLNNLLTPITAYPEIIHNELPPDHIAHAYLDTMEDAGKKIAEISQDLLTMGRRGYYNLEVIDINQVVLQATLDIRSRMKTVTVEVDLCKDLMRIKGGSAQIQRMLTNILVNAEDAMDGIGQITIRTENYYVDDFSTPFGRVPKGEYVKVAISDTGCGIPSDIMQKILDPFFSTKTADKKRGSGLGLSIVDAVMKDHGGYLDLSSKVGHGTSFYLYFPVCRKDTMENESALLTGGAETVQIR